MSKENIPFQVEINRIIELLAKQIYQSPLALLRENCQNAFDAILMRKVSDKVFSPRIDVIVDVNGKQISVEDNGIGMSRNVLKENFWKAGSSGKNNAAAREAGVVGTFGIGAMANFGIADSLKVVTKSIESNEAIVSQAEKATLSASENCISIEETLERTEYGTKVVAQVRQDIPLNLQEVKDYLLGVVKFASVPIYLNNEILSNHDIFQAQPKPKEPEWTHVEQSVKLNSFDGDIEICMSKNADIWLSLTKISYQGNSINGEIVLKQNVRQISTFRSRFALAPAAMSSHYGLGGIVNLSILEPTAGREALTTGSLQLLQNVITEIEKYISIIVAESDLVTNNTSFMNWISAHGRFDLAKNIEINLRPEGRKKLSDIQRESQSQPINVFHGTEQSIIDQYATEGTPLIVVSSSNPRRNIEDNYLRTYCRISVIDTNPQVLEQYAESKWTDSESSFALRLLSILESDYFVTAIIKYAKISHNLPIHVEARNQPVTIFINSKHPTIDTFLKMYDSDFLVMSGVAKDFIRSTVFPKISNLVPSSTRRGAEAFLRAIKNPKDIFEYEKSDLSGFSEIWQDYLDGKISLPEAAQRSTAIVRETVQVVDKSQTGNVNEVLPDIVKNQQVLDQNPTENAFQALPAISRLNLDVPFKLLIMNVGQKPLNGYTCFLALSDRTRKERGDFFLQPHRTEIIWGGQKVLFIFQHHSKEFGLYYELKSNGLISQGSGGGERQTSTIVLKNKIFIPIPDEIKSNFIPTDNEKKSFEVRCELLYPDSAQQSP